MKSALEAITMANKIINFRKAQSDLNFKKLKSNRKEIEDQLKQYQQRYADIFDFNSSQFFFCSYFCRLQTILLHIFLYLSDIRSILS